MNRVRKAKGAKRAEADAPSQDVVGRVDSTAVTHFFIPDEAFSNQERVKTREFLQKHAAVVDIAERNKLRYTPEHGGTVGDETTILHAASDLLSRIYPRERVEKALGDLAAAERETTGRATEPPRPDWIEARKQPGKVADLLAQFIRAKFADELTDSTMSTQKLYRYKGLHRAFYNHKDKLPPDLQDMPTRSEVNDRMVAEGKVRPLQELKAFDRQRGQVRRAIQRGVIPPI